MISRKIKTFSLILAVLMVVTLIVPKADFTERPSVSETETELKEFAVSDKDLKEIVSISLPNTITKIGRNAFSGCENLYNFNRKFIIIRKRMGYV